jgi:hypothetical protein
LVCSTYRQGEQRHSHRVPLMIPSLTERPLPQDVISGGATVAIVCRGQQDRGVRLARCNHAGRDVIIVSCRDVTDQS